MVLQYTPLEPRRAEIRLVEILPGQPDHELCCSLRIVSLDTDPTYEALSYVWGATTTLVPVTVDNFPHQVTPNLASALRNLRELSETRIIWADALCINQSDVYEKNDQIPLMPRIYKGASTVICYLGDDDDADIKHFATWGKLLSPKLSKRLSLQWAGLRIRSLFSAASRLELQILVEQAVNGEMEFVTHQYFQRLWTFQEGALAGQNRIFLQGRSSLKIDGDSIIDTKRWGRFSPLDIFELKQAATRLVLRRGDDRAKHLDQIIERVDRRTRKRVLQGRFLLQHHAQANVLLEATFEEDYPLCMLLFSTIGRRSFDPRDRVFALYGLAPKFQSIYPADYTKAPDDIVWEVLCHVWQFESYHSCDILQLFPLRPLRLQNTRYPSWLPELSTANQIYPRPRLGNVLTERDGELRVRISKDRRVLIVSGWSLGQCQILMRFGSDKQEVVAQLASLIHATGSSSSDQLRQLFGTLSQHRLPQRLALACLNHDFSIRPALSAEDLATFISNALAGLPGSLERIHGSVREHQIAPISFVLEQLCGRVLFTTQSGQLGICIHDVSNEDVVVVSPRFGGCIVLRQAASPEDGMYKFVDWAFVDGLDPENEDETLVKDLLVREFETFRIG